MVISGIWLTCGNRAPGWRKPRFRKPDLVIEPTFDRFIGEIEPQEAGHKSAGKGDRLGGKGLKQRREFVNKHSEILGVRYWG
jgi:hypothetical protein